MKTVIAIQTMSALAQSTRLEVYRQLVRALPAGMAAGDIAAVTGTSPTSMSGHLAILSRVGLVSSKRMGRSIIYRAETKRVEALSTFLHHVSGGEGGGG